jgi:hypothetical protein
VVSVVTLLLLVQRRSRQLNVQAFQRFGLPL